MASPFSSSSSSSSSSEIHHSAIDAIIAEATDLCALEQIAALNTAHLSDSSSSLPTNLETRFRKLKTLPPATVPTPLPTTATSPPPQRSYNNQEEEEKENIPTPTTHDPKPELSSPNQPINIEPEIKTANKASAPPPSPPPLWQASCCFCFSPKKIQRRRKSNAAGVGSLDDELHDIFSEMGSSSSMKESRRRLQKAWKEQEKASQEAEKMVKWVKQVSTRIKEASIEELLDEEFK